VGYNAEQSLSNLQYRFGPNYSIMKRVLCEVQSLLGGKPPPAAAGNGNERGKRTRCFEPKRVLDFGCGVGSSGAAALDVFGVSRRGGDSSTTTEGIEWIHSIDASQSMRETTDRVLTSVLQDAPWEDNETSKNRSDEDMFDEELANYEKAINQIRGDKHSQKRLERQRKRLSKWEHTWNKQLNSKTRLTFGESIVDTSSFYSDQMNVVKDDRPPLPWQSKLDEQRRKTKEKKKEQQSTTTSSHKQGSFDLILCSYTLSELPNVPSSLAAATLLWEKLAPNGILVFVEPGTPDGFGILRSVRSMLLECCPPPEIKEKRKREAEAVAAAAMEEMKVDAEEETKDDDESSGDSAVVEEGEALTDVDEDIWPEECHVIAPCTHNGSCPMSRHERNHIKRNTRFAKYHAAEPNESVEEDEGGKGDDQNQGEVGEDSDLRDILDGWEDLSESDKDELKMMIGDGDDISDDELKAMLEYMDSEDLDSDSDEEDIDDDSDVDDEREFYNIDSQQEDRSNESPNKDSSTMAQTDVFGTSFCSFVHQFPGGTSRKKGEKFTYLVLQKRVPDLHDSSLEAAVDSEEALLDEIDVVDMMSESVYHGQQLKKEELKKRLNQKRLNAMNGKDSNGQEEIETYDTHHLDQSFETLQQAVEVEDAFLDSNVDRLGLEMLIGDDRRKGWGRLIRAPLKKKGHVLIDYCSAGCGGSCPKKNNIDEDDWFEERQNLFDGTKGRITRQKVSKGWSARSAPGSYSAARRARWGGLWPDILERVKRKQKN